MAVRQGGRSRASSRTVFMRKEIPSVVAGLRKGCWIQ